MPRVQTSFRRAWCLPAFIVLFNPNVRAQSRPAASRVGVDCSDWLNEAASRRGGRGAVLGGMRGGGLARMETGRTGAGRLRNMKGIPSSLLKSMKFAMQNPMRVVMSKRWVCCCRVRKFYWQFGKGCDTFRIFLKGVLGGFFWKIGCGVQVGFCGQRQ